jgi:uncharacterized protein
LHQIQMMKKIIFSAILLSAAGSACTNSKVEEQKTATIQTQKPTEMRNLISIVEIPVTDLSRAIKFYQSVLGVTIEEMEMDGNQMGVLPNEEGTVNVVLVKGNDYKPVAGGSVLYLNPANDLQPVLDKVAQNGGQVILPKTIISPEMGFYALFIDSEGNKLGLHSAQ